MNATIKLEKKHFPVLLDELISIISPLYGGSFIDCTFGQGGYSKKILEHKQNKVFAIDRDEKTFPDSEIFKKKFGKRFNYQNITFREIDKINLIYDDIKAILFDLGYSTIQIKDPSKGISFNSKGKLNMRMGINQFSAHEVVNKMSLESLQKIFKYFGEEKKSKIFAKKIVLLRKKKIIQTEDLINIINFVKKAKKTKIHNATKTFQSLRVFVNQEVSQLIYGLINSFKILPVGGMIVVITFHSLEDKIVKFFFKNYSENKNTSRYLPEKKKTKQLFSLIKKKPIFPSKEELKINPSSRSAKLRYAIKTNDSDDFNEFLTKFEYLLDIEKLSEKL